MSRRVRLLREIGKEDVKGYRGHKMIVPQAVIDQLKPDSVLRTIFESPEDLEHRAWLQEITDRVNRRLGNR
jgi:hypothetical protein